MNIRDLAFLACRLFALYAFYILILNGTILIDKIGIEIFRENLNSNPLSSTKGFIGAITLHLSATLLLWFGAPFLSKLLVPKGNQTGPANKLDPLDSAQILTTAIILLGLFLICTTTPIFFSQVIIHAMQEKLAWNYGLISLVSQISVGFILIIGGKPIAETIHRLRKWSVHDDK